MAKGRFRRGQTVYLRYHHAQLLRGLMADPDGPLLFVSMQPAPSAFGRMQCRLRPLDGLFLDGSSHVDVPSNIVVVVPRDEQVAEEREKLAARR